jgi:hypothetical protein
MGGINPSPGYCHDRCMLPSEQPMVLQPRCQHFNFLPTTRNHWINSRSTNHAAPTIGRLFNILNKSGSNMRTHGLTSRYHCPFRIRNHEPTPTARNHYPFDHLPSGPTNALWGVSLLARREKALRITHKDFET